MSSSKLSRRQVREKVVQALFQMIRPQVEVEPEVALAFALEAGNDPAEGYHGVQDAYLKRLVDGIMKESAHLDAKIATYLSQDWTFDRIARIDLAILRLAFYEILYVERDEVPIKVAVNEAVELAKTFSDDKSKQFVNGVLAKFVMEL